MILAVDVGNTVTAVGGFSDGILFTERLSTERSATEFEYAMKLRSVCELYGHSTDSIEGAVVSSVVPTLTDTICRGIMKLGISNVKTVGPGIKTGLSIRIDDPAQLGSGLVTQAVAAANEYPCPVIIIDMGTAISIGVVDKNRCYIGGVLMPGIQISADALRKRTSQLPNIPLSDAPRRVICTNTVDCMRSGALYGTACTIDGLIDRMSEELGCTPSLVATGSPAEKIAALTRHKLTIDPLLAMKGLYMIYNKNR